MNLNEIAAALGVENYSHKLIEVFENLDKVCVDPCDKVFLGNLEKEYGILKEHFESVLAAAEEVKNNPILYPWVKTVATAIKTGTVQDGNGIPTPVSDKTLAGDWMPLLMLLPSIPDVQSFYRKLGFDEADVNNVLQSFYRGIESSQKNMGRPGYNRSYFNWQLTYVRGELFRFKSFNYELRSMPCGYILKNRENGTILPLTSGGKYHRSGMELGSAGFEDEEGSFEATFTETEDAYIGHPAVDFRILRKAQTYLKTEWECVLRPGDNIVSVHIPAKTDLSPEAVEKSYTEGLEFIDKFFPHFKPKAYFCNSWLMDPHLAEILGNESKIAQFQNGFTRWASASNGREIYSFVFVGFKGEIKDLPEDTTLMRGIKNLYLEGDYILGYNGVLFR